MTKIIVDWDKTIVVSKTTATMMHMVHPISRKPSLIHDKAIEAIKDLDANFVRYLNWHVYPRLSIAELYPPTKDETFWDFSLIDAELVPFLEATKGRQPVISFAAIPAWMFKQDKPISYPDDPEGVSFASNRELELLDPTGKQVADYFTRIFSWYTLGGFTDENGRYHESGYHYDLPWWEVLNEAEYFTPQQLITVSDAIISAIQKINPKTKFIGLSIGEDAVDFFEYFLDPKNHAPGVPLDMIAYHFYSWPHADLLKLDLENSDGVNDWQYSFFDQAACFVERVKYIESIRKRLSPSTQVNLNEVGTYYPGDFDISLKELEIPPAYWNLSGGVFAYLYMALAKEGIDIIAQSLLATAPGLAPGNSMLNWDSGRPNARFHVLKLLKDNFGPGDKLTSTRLEPQRVLQEITADIAVQAFDTAKGRKILLINKRAFGINVMIDGAGASSRLESVDVTTGESPAAIRTVKDGAVHLEPFAVAVMSVD